MHAERWKTPVVVLQISGAQHQAAPTVPTCLCDVGVDNVRALGVPLPAVSQGNSPPSGRRSLTGDRLLSVRSSAAMAGTGTLLA
jgi:hypothetical protein